MIQAELKKRLKQLLFSLLLIFFLLNLTTGIIKFPEFQRYFTFVYSYISSGALSWIHDVSGVGLVGLIFIHLTMKRKELGTYFFGSSGILPRGIRIIYLILGILFFAAVVWYADINYFSVIKPIDLSGVEIKDYNGEKLGSVYDFRQNAISGAQYIDISGYTLEVFGLVSSPRVYTYQDILKLQSYRKVVTLNCVEGWSVKALWEGVLVRDLFKDLTIKPEAKTVIFHAHDGYTTSFPLEYILRNDIIMADKINGVVLPPDRGFPIQLIAEQKWGYKWIRWITKIELSSDTNYKGYWESRGYNNNGDLNGSKFSE
jgi:hypothetical protein